MLQKIYGRDLVPEYEDYETFYATKFSLSSSSYTEYVNDERFRVELLARCGTEGDGEIINGARVADKLNKINWKNTLFVSHNALFDALILKTIYGIEAGAYFCTMMGMKVLANHAHHDLETCGELTKWIGPKKSELGPAIKNARNKHLENMTRNEKIAYMRYAKNDVHICRHIAQTIMPILPKQELLSIDMYVKRFLNPTFVLDENLCSAALNQEKEETDTLIEKALPILRTLINEKVQFENLRRVNENSPQTIVLVAPTTISQARNIISRDAAFAGVFKYACNKIDIDLPMKISDTGNNIPAISNKDDEFLILSEHNSLKPLIDARLAVKSSLVRTRLQRFINTAKHCNGKIPWASVHHSAHTGRPGATNNINLMNLPRIVKNQPKASDALRLSLTAPKKHAIVVADFSNIEPRLTDWFCEQEEFLKAYRNGDDPYATLASKMHKRTITKDSDPELRNAAKVQKLLLNYGAGWRKYKTTLALGAMGAPPEYISEAEARHRVYNEYRPANPGLTKTWDFLDWQITQMLNPHHSQFHRCVTFAYKQIKLPSERALDYSGLEKFINEDTERVEYRYGLKKKTAIYSGKMLENLMQALARDIHTTAMLTINREIAPVIGDAYDEIITCVPESQADDILKSMIEVMTRPVPWALDLPLAAEGGIDYRYSK